MKQRKTHSQLYMGFEILVEPENEGYSVYLSTKDEYIEPLSKFKIIENALNCLKAIKKAQDIIDEISWKFLSNYGSIKIYLLTGFTGWAYKIITEEMTIVKNQFSNKEDAIQSAFIQADKEWQKLSKK